MSEGSGRDLGARGSEQRGLARSPTADGDAKTGGKRRASDPSGRVLARLLKGQSTAGADLRFLWFSYANFSGVDFRNANLEGANLSQADLSGADLRGANLRSAKLQGANLRGAMLEGATFSGAMVHGADFTAVQGLSIEQEAALGRLGAVIDSGC